MMKNLTFLNNMYWPNDWAGIKEQAVLYSTPLMVMIK